MGHIDQPALELLRTLHQYYKVLLSTTDDPAINGKVLHATHPICVMPCMQGEEKKRLIVKTPPFTVDVVKIFELGGYHPEADGAAWRAVVEPLTVTSSGCWIDGVFYEPGAVVETAWVNHPFLRELTEEEEVANQSLGERLYGAFENLTGGSGKPKGKKKGGSE